MMSESIFANQVLQAYIDSTGNTDKYEEILTKLTQIIPNDVVEQPIFKTILSVHLPIYYCLNHQQSFCNYHLISHRKRQ